MNLLIKGIKIVAPNSQFNGKTCDVRVESGIIKTIDTALKADEGEFVFEGKDHIMSPGFFDLNCDFGDPGYETKEDIQTGTLAAAAGGYTGVALMPNTFPIIQSKAEVDYIINKAKGNLVEVYPIGAISKNFDGKELTEMYDMKNAGAVAFADTDKAIVDDGFMSRAVQYALGFDGLLFVYPENKSISGKAQVNESKTTVLLGMKGIPAVAEELQITRDIYLAQYHQSPLHICNISTAGAVDVIRKVKSEGLKITCDVAINNLSFTEEMLNNFDSNYKVKPPLRSQSDVAALIAGLKDGTIDAIVSQHRPHDVEYKNVEFEIAKYGTINLQTVLPMLLKAGLSIDLIVEKLAINPRNILKLNQVNIASGEKANFCIISPSKEWTFNAENNKSKSSNSALLNQKLTGKIEMIYNQNQVQIFS